MKSAKPSSGTKPPKVSGLQELSKVGGSQLNMSKVGGSQLNIAASQQKGISSSLVFTGCLQQVCRHIYCSEVGNILSSNTICNDRSSD